MIIIEFFGLPGAGKSTVCDLLEVSLLKHGYGVVNLHKREKADSLKKKIEKLLHIIRYWTWSGNRKLKKVLRNFSKQCYYNDSHKWIDRILELNYLIFRNDKHLDIGLLDEGFVQWISSICFDKPYKHSAELMQVINSIIMCHDYYLVHCEILPAEALSRVSSRNRKNDRYNLSSKKANELLEIKNENLVQIASNIDKMNLTSVSTGNERTTQSVVDELQMYFHEKGLL